MTETDHPLEITRVDPDDAAAVTGAVSVQNAARSLDSPWQPLLTAHEETGALRHGWDGEPVTGFLGTLEGEPVTFGSIGTSERDNLALAWLEVQVRPDRRRHGLGSAVLEHLLDVVDERGRTSVGSDCWDDTPGAAFAVRHGFALKSVAVNRRQVLTDLDWDLVSALHAQAQAASSAYEVVRRIGPSPDDELDAVAVMVAAINDAPTDELDIEDEVFSAERVRAYETAQAARGLILHRVLARHLETGELAGHSVVTVDRERPELGEQHDTSVLAAHRGHRLGLLLKSEMNLWLREVEPQLTQIDTWNAESNDQMIGVNSQLGYRVLGRELQFQRAR